MRGDEKCAWPGCRNPRTEIYEGKPLCDQHGSAVTHDDQKKADAARKKIGLKSSLWKAPPKTEPEPAAEVTPLPAATTNKCEDAPLQSWAERLANGEFD